LYQNVRIDHAILQEFLTERSSMSGAGGRTRREILADAAKAAAAASVAGLAGCFPSVGGKWPDAGGKNACLNRPDGGSDAGSAIEKPPFFPATNAVVEVFDEGSVTKKGAKDFIQDDVVAGMLATGLKALASQIQNANAESSDGGAPGAADANVSSHGDEQADAGSGLGDAGTEANLWNVLLPSYRPGQRIGLKINCLNGNVPTSGAIIRAIVTSLRDGLSIEPSNIIVWDRTLDDIKTRGRYTDDQMAGARVMGTLAIAGKVTDGDPDYGDIICPPIEDETPRLSRIMTDMTHLTINVPVLKTHNVSGVTAAMKNIYGIIDIPGRYHKPKLQTALPAIYALPAVRNALVLTITDALIGIVTGDTDSGTDISPKRILLAQDPVAMDNYALALVNQLRAGLTPPKGPVDETVLGWIDRAHQLGLGNKNYALVKASL
jgi:hypothetical protein